MALAAGVVVATAVADLLPEAFSLVGEDHILEAGIAAVIGFIGFSLIEAFLHQASFEHAGAHGHAHDHGLRSDRGHEGGDEDGDQPATQRAAIEAPATSTRPPMLLGVLPPASLIVHSTLDGLAIGLAFRAGTELGLIVLLAVLAHDFADGMNVVTLALDAARGERLAVIMLVLDAVAPPFGAALSTVVTISDQGLGVLLATFAGVFLAIGAGHLLPESQHHDQRRGPTMVLLAGIGAAIVLVVRALGAG